MSVSVTEYVKRIIKWIILKLINEYNNCIKQY